MTKIKEQKSPNFFIQINPEEHEEKNKCFKMFCCVSFSNYFFQHEQEEHDFGGILSNGIQWNDLSERKKTKEKFSMQRAVEILLVFFLGKWVKLDFVFL